MSLDKWQFLDAWAASNDSSVAAPYSEHHTERGCSIAPHASIHMRLSLGNSSESTRTVELMALAIRVDERVWEKLYVDYGNPRAALKSEYRPDDLELHVVASMYSHTMLCQYFAPMAVACDADRKGPTSVAAYLDAQRRISELDVGHRLRRFQIPLTFLLFIINVDEAAQCIAWLERLVTSGRVAIRGAANTLKDHEGRRAMYVLEAVKIAPFIGLYPEVLIAISNGYWRDFDFQALGSQGLNHLHALGVPITTAVGRVQDDPLFLSWMAPGRALTLVLLVESNAELRTLHYCAPSPRTPHRIDALPFIRGLDVTLAVMLLRDVPRVCPSLRSLELIDSFDNSVWVTLRDLLEAAPVAVHSHPVRAFAMVLRQNVLPREVIPLIAQWLPCLESLTVRPYSAGRFATDDARLRLILEAFPQLEALALREASLTTWCDLLDAYETRGCRIRTLSVGNHGVSYVPLLEAPACPTSRIAQTLRELEIYASPLADPTSMLPATETMLQANRLLECFRLRLSWSHFWNQRDAIKGRLERFHREPLDKLTCGRGALLMRLAFLSVVHRAPIPGMHALDAGVLSLIFALACERLLRLVDVATDD